MGHSGVFSCAFSAHRQEFVPHGRNWMNPWPLVPVVGEAV